MKRYMYAVRFDTKSNRDVIEYVYAYSAKEARDKISAMYPGIFNTEIIARYE